MESTTREIRVSEVELRQNCFWARDAVDDKSHYILEWDQIIEVYLILPKDKIVISMKNISVFIFKLPFRSAFNAYKAMFEECKFLKPHSHRFPHDKYYILLFKPTNGQENDEAVEMIEMQVLGDGGNEGEPEDPEISEFDQAADVQAVGEEPINKV